MAHFLVKSEPFKYPWSRMVQDGTTFWDGVRNYQASNNMKAMQLGDTGFFYHSNEERAIVGIVEVVKLYYPDHTDETGKFGMVDLKAVAGIKRPVTLTEVKADPALQHLQLATHSRLSVSTVDDAAWAHILKMAGGTVPL